MMLIRTRWWQLSRRGATLLLFGAVYVALGYSYLTLAGPTAPFIRRSLRLALEVAPLGVYAWAWIVCGVAAIIGGAVHRFDGLGFGAAVLMPIVWAVAYLAAQIIDGVPRAWLNALIFALLAAALWIVAGMVDPLDAGHPKRRRH